MANTDHSDIPMTSTQSTPPLMNSQATQEQSYWESMAQTVTTQVVQRVEGQLDEVVTQRVQERMANLLDSDKSSRNVDQGKMYGFKIPNPSPYNGKIRNPAAINSWFLRLEQCLELGGIARGKWIAVAATFLIGDAFTWYQHYMQDWVDGQPTWQMFRTALLDYFSEHNAELKDRDKWRELTQKGSVASYNAQFMRLQMRLKIPEDIGFDKYVNGLRDKIYSEVMLREPQNVEQAMALADKIETIQARTSLQRTGKTFGKSKDFIKHKPVAALEDMGFLEDTRGTPMDIDVLENRPNFQKNKKFNGKCFNCGIEGHRKADCKKPLRQGPSKGQAKNKKTQ